jgi:UDPglucose--hexose-1-phosphate uridylyltransferase
MFERELKKPDGRLLTLYSRTPIPSDLVAPSPSSERSAVNPHFRWHPLRAEWVAYAGHRQARTFLPPADFNPLRASNDPAALTELPAGAYDIAVFDNLFPAMSLGAHDAPPQIVPTAPATGHCEVVVFTQDPDTSLGALPLDHIELLFEVWARRTRAMRDRHMRYVLPFENRGEEVGVTLHPPTARSTPIPSYRPYPYACSRSRESFSAHMGAQSSRA